VKTSAEYWSEILTRPVGASYGEGKEDLISAIVNMILSETCTKGFKDAGLKSPAELLNSGAGKESRRTFDLTDMDKFNISTASNYWHEKLWVLCPPDIEGKR
jgi:hypothetical protein